jgi:hypothetical protein
MSHEAWLRLHCDKKRNFFAYPTDVAFLCHIQGRLLQEQHLLDRQRSCVSYRNAVEAKLHGQARPLQT